MRPHTRDLQMTHTQNNSLRLHPRPAPALVSLVIPMYNEEETVPFLCSRVTQFIDSLPCAAEVLLVDDGSSDRTLPAIHEWARRDERIHVIALSRNFGHQAAATAGLDRASGDAIVLMDADLQDPPELIHDMLVEYQRGYAVVYAQRAHRLGDSFFKRATAWIFYRLMRKLVYPGLPHDTGDYRLVSRPCLEALKQMRETHRFLRGMVAWVGFPQTAVRFERQARVAGQTKYPLRKMLRFAWTAATSFSPTPLRLTFALGLFVAVLGAGAGIYAVVALFAGMYVVVGWTSLMATSCLIGSAMLICIGILGEYVAKIYEEAKGRPLYIVDEAVSTPACRTADVELRQGRSAAP